MRGLGGRFRTARARFQPRGVQSAIAEQPYGCGGFVTCRTWPHASSLQLTKLPPQGACVRFLDWRVGSNPSCSGWVDDVIANHAHSAVSRPRPRMGSLIRKGRGGRGGTCGIGRRVRTRASLYPIHSVPPLPTHLLPYVPGWSSSDVFTAASSVHTGSRDPIPRVPGQWADDVIANHVPHRRVTATSKDGQPDT